MSLTSLLDKIAGIFAKQFVIAAFLPTLIFAFVNGCLVRGGFRWLMSWFTPQSPGASALDAAVTSVALVVGAYLLSSVNVLLRETLEGKHFPRWLSDHFEASERGKYSLIDKKYREARDEAERVGNSRADWQRKLSGAAVTGDGKNAYVYATRSDAIARLHEQIEAARAVPSNELEDAVNMLCVELEKSSVSRDNGENDLERDRSALLDVLDDAEDAWRAREVRNFGLRSHRFGSFRIEPTIMGNIAQSMLSYGPSRYGLNAEAFWSRMQPTIQANKDFYASIQDAKTQLDFLIACCWLTTGTTGFWVVRATFGPPSILFLLLMAGLGPMAARMFYLLACESYVTFAELVRTSIDLYRFALLKSLHMRLPSGIREERAIWNALQGVAAFGQQYVNISYQHDPEKGA
jgi:hypothetical protein